MNNRYIKYFLLSLLPLIINGFSFQLINSFFVNKRTVINPIKMCSNSYLDSLNIKNIIKKNDVKTNNFINTTLLTSLTSPKINTNTIFFNTYYVDDMLIEKNLTKIILNFRKGNHSLYYINKTNDIETIKSSRQLSSKIIKNIIFTDLNKVMNNSLGIIYDDSAADINS
jgi:hypothetical protein